MKNTDPAVDAAMQIILKAGDGRACTFKALRAVESGDFPAAQSELSQAQAKLREAHRVHTKIIQGEAAGEENTFSALFTHAQDTLMTANSEYRLVKRMTGIFERYEHRLIKLEEAR